MRPFATCGATTLLDRRRPACAFSRLTSFSTHGMPRAAFAWAMPAPIMPAPSTPTFAGFQRGKPAGRDWPDLIAFRLKKNAVIDVLRRLPDHHLRELAALDARRGVVVDQRALDHRLEDRLGSPDRGRASSSRASPARPPARRRSSGCSARRPASGSPCRPTAATASGWLAIQASAAGAQALGAVRQAVDEAELERLARVEQLALEQVRLRGHQAEQPHRLRDAGGARDQARARPPACRTGSRRSSSAKRGSARPAPAPSRRPARRRSAARRPAGRASRCGESSASSPRCDRTPAGGVLRLQLQHALQLGAGEERRLRRGEQHAADALLVALELRGGLGRSCCQRSVIVLTAEPGSSNVSVAMPSASIA